MIHSSDDDRLSNGFGLLTPARQRMWLRGIAQRCERGQRVGDETRQRQEIERQQLAVATAEQHAATLADCRHERRELLERWDDSDEQLISDYETQTLATREERRRQLSVLRRKHKQATENAKQQFEQDRQRLAAKYAEEKPKPAAYEKREHSRLNGRLEQILATVIEARRLSSVRLGGEHKYQAVLASHEIDDLEGATPTEAHSTEDCLTHLGDLERDINNRFKDLKSGWAAKMIESYYMLPIALMAGGIWCAGVYFLSPEQLAIWMLGGIPVTAVVGGLILFGGGFPLRRRTKDISPEIERLAALARGEAAGGKQWITARAKERAAKLLSDYEQAQRKRAEEFQSQIQQLDTQYAADKHAIEQQHDEHLASIDGNFRQSYATSNRTLWAESEQTAQALSARIKQCEHEIAQQQSDQQQRHQEELDYLWHRLEQALARVINKAESTGKQMREHFPAWEQVLNLPNSTERDLRWLPVGDLSVGTDVRSHLGDNAEHVPEHLPLTLARESQSTLLIDCPPEQMHVAADIVRGILWRSLTAVAPGRVRLTMFDPIGHGHHFSSLVSLADHDPQLIGHRAWSAPAQITARLAELIQHVEDILQTCLRDRYARIEEYNADAGSMAEPYRVVAAIGLPAGLTHEGSAALRALVEGGRRCGVFLLLVRDTSQPWPNELPEFPDSHVLKLNIDAKGKVHHGLPGLDQLPVTPVTSPPASAISTLTQRIGEGAISAQRVEIPLDSCVPVAEYDRADSSEGLTIPVGRQGVGRSLAIDLGRGMRQHVLVAGKTGSGKSTLLHSMITSAALLYPPDQLHLYLLDFKKGVEFKVYADAQLPHARVIGIESEREFGRSVLERLDEELQRRGEAFRDAAVQELSEYRRKRPDSLPRILLVVDEFQELFTRDDRIAQECAMYLDRLVRQGRSFGMHVVLSSQSLAGAHSLPRATLGQMAIRIALQCSESDAALILADDNTAARLLSRPGEAIYNDAGGLIEGNQPFQVAWLDNDVHAARLAEIATRHPDAMRQYGGTVIFEGNRPARWSPALASAAIEEGGQRSGIACRGLLGEAVRIGPPTTLSLNDGSGRNLLCVADELSTEAVLASWLTSAVGDCLQHYHAPPRIVFFDGKRGAADEFSLTQWLEDTGLSIEVIRPRDSLESIKALAADLVDEPPIGAPTIVVINPLERFRDLRQDESFGFSLDGASGASGSDSLRKLLSDGPRCGTHLLIGCGNAETLTRWLPRTSHHDLELRVLGRASAADSAQLIDNTEAASLSPATMLLHDDGDGSLQKFRLCAIPAAESIKQWLESL